MTSYIFTKNKSNSTNNKNVSSTMPPGMSFSSQTQKKFNDLNNNIENSSTHSHEVDSEFCDVNIIFPNGTSRRHKIASNKAIYDILIELSSCARLVPTNYTLKLFNDESDNKENDLDAIIDYTPNQKIGQLNPVKIKVVPKTATLKHNHFQAFSSSDKQKRTNLLPVPNNSSSNTTINKTCTMPLKQPENVTKNSNLGSNWIITKQSTQSNTNLATNLVTGLNHVQPFELTICVQVNLPFNQKTVVRVKREILLEDLFSLICREANLDKQKYEFYIPNLQESYTMQDSFACFDTKEVCLALKKHLKDTSHFPTRTTECQYIQNKSHHRQSTNAKIQLANRLAKEVLQRSKSDVDLSLIHQINKSDTEADDSFNSSSSSNTNKFVPMRKAIFGNTKKQSKSRGSLNASECSDDPQMRLSPLCDSKISLNSNQSQEAYYKSKKRLAPAPPPTGINHPALQNIMMKKKDKAPAPPPPKILLNENQLNIETKPNLFSSVSSPSEASSSAFCSPVSSESSQSEQPLPTKIENITNNDNSSLIIPTTDIKLDVVDQIVLSNNMVKVTSSPLSQRGRDEVIKTSDNEQVSEEISGILKRTDSNQSINSEIDASLNNMENSIMSVGSYHLTDDLNSSKPHTIETVETLVKITSLSLNETTVSSHYASNKSLTGVKSSTGAAIGYKSFSDSDDYTELNTFNSPSQHSASKTTINFNSAIALGISTNTYEPRGHKLFESTASLDDSESTLQHQYHTSVESLSSCKDHKLSTMSSIIEVNPSYNPAETIKIEANMPVETPINTSFKTATKIALSLRSPTSPVPQFPAIALDEVNEQHQGFTVVRTGDIIEKNGTYYSSDGTVRGYSGTVRKIAQSKTLDDVFKKHKELEQQHEKEYELEMQNRLKQEMNAQAASKVAASVRAAADASTNKTLITKQTPTISSSSGVKTNFRNSLGSIIATEKRNSASHGLSSTSNIFKQTPRQPINPQDQPVIDDELSRKLENRRKSILAAQQKQEEKLQQRALQKQLHVAALKLNQQQQSLATQPLYENVTIQIDVKSSNSLSSDSTHSNSVLSSSSSTSHTSPTPPPAPAIDKLMSESSSSSSLSTCSYDSSMGFKLPGCPHKKFVSEPTNHVNMLLHELKSVVPRIEGDECVSSLVIEASSQVKNDRIKKGPSTAPKIFSSQTLKTINLKNQVADNRESLLESIKGFSFNSLRRTTTQTM